jgi:hypothetical protein
MLLPNSEQYQKTNIETFSHATISKMEEGK